MTKALPLFLILLFTIAGLRSQSLSPEVWASAGDHYAYADGSISWTLGETAVETYSKPGLGVILTQGFHQPNFLQTGLTPDPEKVSPVFSVFPNPSNSFVRIKLSQPVGQPVQVSLYNTLGQLIQSELWLPNASQPEMVLPLEGLSNGVYFVQLNMEGKDLGVFKVQKNQP